MSEPLSPEPAGNQFSLRGMFVLITTVSCILALLALAIRDPLHWLGTLAIAAFCLAVIGVLEAVRRLFPPPPRRRARPPGNLGSNLFRDGQNPFASSPDQSESPSKVP
jgi:hypothetical protein